MQNLFKSAGLEQAECPEDLGIDSSLIENFLIECQKKEYNFKNIIIGRNGKIASRITKKPYDPSFKYASFSSSKPLVAIAIGFAINEGLLRLDTTIEEIFPDRFTQKQLKKIKGITIEHLLTMTAGKTISVLANKEKNDWFDIFVNGKKIAEPGEEFHYISEYTYALGRMLTEVTGLTIGEYLNPRLFEPLGIEKPFWETDNEGYEAGAWGLYWSIEDMAKIAQLFLNLGEWDSVQVVPREWMETMISPLISDLTSLYATDLGFGYQIWANYEGTYYRFEGFYGQYIFIYPKHNAFIVTQSGDARQYEILPLVDKYFPAAFKDAKIEISDEDKANYKSFIENISYDILKPGPRDYAVEESINNNCYRITKKFYLTMQSIPVSFVLAKQPGKMANISFDFKENFAVMSWDEKNYDRQSLIINLDGEIRYSTLLLGQNESHAYACGKWLANGKFRVQVISIESPEVKTFTFNFMKKGISIKMKVKSTLESLIIFKLIFMGWKNRKLVDIIAKIGHIIGVHIFYPPVTFGYLKKKDKNSSSDDKDANI